MSEQVTYDDVITALAEGADTCPDCGAEWQEHDHGRSMVHAETCVVRR